MYVWWPPEVLEGSFITFIQSKTRRSPLFTVLASLKLSWLAGVSRFILLHRYVSGCNVFSLRLARTWNSGFHKMADITFEQWELLLEAKGLLQNKQAWADFKKCILYHICIKHIILCNLTCFEVGCTWPPISYRVRARVRAIWRCCSITIRQLKEKKIGAQY